MAAASTTGSGTTALPSLGAKAMKHPDSKPLPASAFLSGLNGNFSRYASAGVVTAGDRPQLLALRRRRRRHSHEAANVSRRRARCRRAGDGGDGGDGTVAQPVGAGVVHLAGAAFPEPLQGEAAGVEVLVVDVDG